MALFDSIFSGSNGVASIVLNLVGVPAVYTHITKGAYDPQTNIELNTEVTKTVTVSPPLKYKIEEVNGVDIQYGDCKIIGNGEDFFDVNNKIDTIRVSNKTYVIISNSPVYSGSNIASVTLQLRESVNGN